MKFKYNSRVKCMTCEPDCAIEALETLRAIAIGYDGMDDSIESMKQLVDELVRYAGDAIDFINSGKIYFDEKADEASYWAAKADMEAHADEWRIGK